VKIARPREGLGGRSPPRKQLASGEGLGGLRPPKNNNMFILALCGAAAWMTEVKIARPREGLGGLRPPKNDNMFILALCGAAT